MDNGYSVNFHIIHPSIIDLYINALTLHILQEQLTKVGPDGLSQDVQAEINRATNDYTVSVKRAEALFGNPSIVQDQLDVFASRRQGTA